MTDNNEMQLYRNRHNSRTRIVVPNTTISTMHDQDLKHNIIYTPLDQLLLKGSLGFDKPLQSDAKLFIVVIYPDQAQLRPFLILQDRI